MPTLLTRLKINEISSVDRGAGKSVRVFLHKRDDASPVCKECGASGGEHLAKCSKFTKAEAWGTTFLTSLDDLEADVSLYCKREFSQDERDEAARRGQAMPGGGFPIKSEQDLRNAIRAIGRAKNPEAARRHIKERARALGATDLIPESWGKAAPPAHEDEDEDRKLIAEMLAEHDAPKRKNLIGDIMKAASENGAPTVFVARARSALAGAVAAALEIDKAEDRVAAIAKSVGQCVEFLAAVVPEASHDAFQAAVAAIPVVAKGGTMKTLTLEELTAHVEKLAKRNTYLEAMLKLPEDQRAYMDVAKLDEAAREAFVAKADDERKAIVTAAAKAKKAKDGDGKDGDDDDDDKDGKKDKTEKKELADLKKRVAAFEAAEEERVCKALCRDNGLAEGDHVMLAKLRKADPEAATEMLKRTRGLAAQANPKLFTELGKGGGGTDDPTAAINAKADELMAGVNKSAKSAAERISIQKARMLVREQNPELAKAERDLEQRRRLGRAA